MNARRAMEVAPALTDELRDQGMEEAAQVLDALRHTIAVQTAVTGRHSADKPHVRVVGWDGIVFAVGDRVTVERKGTIQMRGKIIRQIMRFILIPATEITAVSGPIQAELAIAGSLQHREYARMDELRRVARW